jgi:predicted phage-related endonuclease
MELLKKLLDLVKSWFENKTAKTKEDITLADKTEEATVEKIRATANAKALENQQILEQNLAKLHEEQKVKELEEEKKPIEEQLDNQFGKGE